METFYHVYIKHKDDDEIFTRKHMIYGLSEEEVIKGIADPFNNNKELRVREESYDPKQILQILFFVSNKSHGSEIFLPNGKNAREELLDIVIQDFQEGKVPEVSISPKKFLIPIKKKEEKL
jgi:hypothetical protein